MQLGRILQPKRHTKTKINSAVISEEPGAKTECKNKSRALRALCTQHHKKVGKPPKPRLQPEPTPTLTPNKEEAPCSNPSGNWQGNYCFTHTHTHTHTHIYILGASKGTIASLSLSHTHSSARAGAPVKPRLKLSSALCSSSADCRRPRLVVPRGGRCLQRAVSLLARVNLD